ncbi:MAG TPA: type II toxin-antitoxin system prevent-host-death family antitoxin [Vicinamibacterales bacterium]|jgi:prevent-host-death family protein|nr:type II toxin-antitoxin system Phd/YefM family antitoxin [Acidobacteriota bacterium]HQX81391.1 type II toxin-antitoxin system prevent-host-death family antitoxin [Vicinamibacterales bacterium]
MSILTIVEEMAISKFKATCLSVVERVRKTRAPILITRHGVPVAQIGPPQPAAQPKSWLGSMAGTVTILGDIVGPVTDPDDWEAMRD